jgi:hypothetical protein
LVWLLRAIKVLNFGMGFKVVSPASSKTVKISKTGRKSVQIQNLKFGDFFKNRDKLVENLGLPFDISINHCVPDPTRT